MSSEWKLERLGDNCLKIGSGSTPTGGKDAYLEHGPYTLIRSQNIYNDGFTPNGLAFIGEAQAKKLNGVSVENNDVLLNITGDSVARVCLAPSRYLPARVNQHVAIIRPNIHSFDSRYLRYFLASPQQQDLMLGLASAGATRPALTKVMIENFKIPCPPIKVQQSIADILSSLDDRISLLRKTNTTLEAIAQALFKSWFVDFNPVRDKQEGRAPEGMDEATAALFPDSFEELELGLMPKGWVIRKAEALLTRLSTKVRYTKEQVQSSGATPVYEQGAGILLGYHDGRAHFQATPNEPIFIFGDHTCITHLSCEPFDISMNVIAVKGSDRPTLWTYYAIKDKQTFQEYRRHWMELAVKSVIVPPLEVCVEFSRIASSIHLKIESNARQVNILATLRDTLLPRLISGQLRLPEAN